MLAHLQPSIIGNQADGYPPPGSSGLQPSSPLPIASAALEGDAAELQIS